MIFQNGDKVVFAGDSVTDSGRKRPVGEGLWEGVGTGYVRVIDSVLATLYPEMLVHVINMGVSGADSKDLLSWWERDILSLKPDWLFMMIGANDVWRQFDEPYKDWSDKSPQAYRANVAKLIDKGLASGVKGMIVLSPFYIEANDNDVMKKRMVEYANIAKEESAKRGVKFIDLQPAFDEHVKHRYPAYITWDRVHPSWVGSMIIARAILAEIGCKPLF